MKRANLISKKMSQNKTRKNTIWFVKNVVVLTLSSFSIHAQAQLKQIPNDFLVDQPSVPYLTKTEVQRMQLLRLWHTRPVVEGFTIGTDIFKNDRNSLDLNYLPEQIQGRHAKFYSKIAGDVVHAKDVACRSDLKKLQSKFESKNNQNYKSDVYDNLSGVVRMGGLTYAKSYEPVVNRQSDDRYKYMTSIQAGQNFSFGGWIRYARPEIERLVYELQSYDKQNNRSSLRNLIPGYYSFLGKAPDQFDKISMYDFNQKDRRLGEYVRDMKPEWQFYMTSETLFLGSFQGNEQHHYYDANTEQNNKAIVNYAAYQACLSRQEARNQAQAAPALPLARSLKPVPPPIDVKPPVVVSPLPPEDCTPSPILLPPVAGGVNKKHNWDFDIKKFRWAETWSSSYLQAKSDDIDMHYEAWHFLNVTFDLANPVRPTIKLSIISLPYLDRLPQGQTYNTLSRCLFKVKDKTQPNAKAEMLAGDQCRFSEFEISLTSSTSALAQLLMNETDSPVTIGSGYLDGESEDGVKITDRIYRSGTYISRAALNKNQLLRMAEILYPAPAANCLAKDLKPIFSTRTDFSSEY